MKISDFKRLSNTLSKTIHAVSLCFDTVEVSDASISYDGGFYHLNFRCYVEDYGVSNFSNSSTGDDASLLINKFFHGLISDIDSNLSELNEEENNDDQDWKEWRIYNHEHSCLPRIASLEMLKGILLGFKG